MASLLQAVGKRDCQSVQNLLQEKADVDQTNFLFETPLQIAATGNDLQIVEILVNAKADVNRPDICGASPLLSAAAKANTSVVKCLIDAKADVNQADCSGIAPLHRAISGYKFNGRENTLDTVSLLLKEGAKASVGDQIGVEAPLHLASRERSSELVKMLLDAGAEKDVNWEDLYGKSALHWAASNGDVEIVNLLIEAGTNVNQRGKYGDTPLHLAALNGHAEVVEILLAEGARESVNSQDTHGCTPLYCAVYKGHIKVVELLLKAGAGGVNETDDNGKTLLFFASGLGSWEMVELLLEHGAKDSVNQPNNLGETALHRVALNPNKNAEGIVEILLKYGADANQTDKYQKTPLHFAAYYGTPGMVKLLLEYGADPLLLVDEEGQLDRRISAPIKQLLRSRVTDEITIGKFPSGALTFPPPIGGIITKYLME